MSMEEHFLPPLWAQSYSLAHHLSNYSELLTVSEPKLAISELIGNKRNSVTKGSSNKQSSQKSHQRLIETVEELHQPI